MKKNALELILDEIDISDSEYEKAEGRYSSLAEFLSNKSVIKNYNPKVFSQGSFRLGTVIKSLNPEDPYDLDLTCELTNGVSTSNISQKELKELCGNAIDEYIQMNGVKEAKERKHRCWRVNYQGAPSFHMDIVPGIPMQNTRVLSERMAMSNISPENSIAWAALSYNITDDRKPSYSIIDNDWEVSNPKGYALWFESIMGIQKGFAFKLNESLEPLPAFKQKTILQRCVQLFKRHRDVMFFNDPEELKPISIIITTLAARAYQGENTINEAITKILRTMKNHIGSSGIRIPNPTNPDEDFSDKWKKNPKLEQSFYRWLDTAQADFDKTINNFNPASIKMNIKDCFGVLINEDFLSVSQRAKAVNLEQNNPIPISEYQKCLSGSNLALYAPHEEHPGQLKYLIYKVEITPKVKMLSGLWKTFDDFTVFPLPKGKELQFEARTTCPPPYTIRWKVVNTGEEAKQAGCLRGSILNCQVDKDTDKITIRRESSLYKGMHWVQCYVLQGDVIVAESEKCYVPIQ